MKTLLIIRDGDYQIVLTPENNFESEIVATIGKGSMDTKVIFGSYYDCVGGWINGSNDNESLIIRAKNKTS